jgi:CDP-ribitol ribitolphosphotransferase / teichoic acid ribitol-phosphate polymerase
VTALNLVKKIPKRLKKIPKRIAKDTMFDFAFPRAYRCYAQEPVVPGRVLFLETKESAMPDAFDLLWQRFKADPSSDPRFYSLQQNYVSHAQYLKHCPQALREIAQAEIVFLADASDLVSCIDLRPETRVVQLWHACGAFKKWGMSTADLKFGGSREQLLRHPYYKNLSLVTVSSPKVAWAYEEAMVLQDRPEVIKPLGVSRTDKFFDPSFLGEAHNAVQTAVPQTSGKKVLLYAPTFRGRVASAAAPDELDIPALREALGGDWVLLIKHHPFVKQRPSIPADCADFAFDVSDSLSIDKLLCVADVCVSDYSSLVFEYSLFGRPMAFFAYDKDDYDDWRGFYYDYDELTPGPVVTTNAQLIDYLQHLDECFDPEEIRAFRECFMSACDGHATDRILDELRVNGMD